MRICNKNVKYQQDRNDRNVNRNAKSNEPIEPKQNI